MVSIDVFDVKGVGRRVIQSYGNYKWIDALPCLVLD